MAMRAIGFILFACLFFACDTQTKAGPYAELTTKEKARAALDAKDFPEAIKLYSEVIAAEPVDYESYRFLATAYAELGGFDILKAVQSSIGGGATNLMDQIGEFIPESPTAEQIEALRMATNTILLLPETHRSFENPDVETSSSAAQQLQFYQTVYNLMYLKQFAQITPDGSLDPSRLESMTDEDADTILNNLEAIAQTQGGGVMSESVEAFISQLDAAPGESRREKLLAYLEANSQG